MQEVYAEIRGTLARTADKKNTTLYKLHRQRLLQERTEKFGFAERPKYPSQCESLAGAKHFLNDISDEIGQAIARLSNSSLHSIERDGEEKIRALNKEIFLLMRQKQKWVERVKQLQKAAGNRQAAANVDDEDAPVRIPFTFFGCAKLLPEAVAEEERKQKKLQSENRRAEKKLRIEQVAKKDDMDDPVEDQFEEDDIGWPSTALTQTELERLPACQLYRDALSKASSNCLLSEVEQPVLVDSVFCGYVTDFTSLPQTESEVNLPRSSDVMKQVLFDRKKQLLRSRLTRNL